VAEGKESEGERERAEEENVEEDLVLSRAKALYPAIKESAREQEG
jgi:hypothetical protein